MFSKDEKVNMKKETYFGFTKHGKGNDFSYTKCNFNNIDDHDLVWAMSVRIIVS